MTDTLTTSSDVVVAVDAATAFQAFTEEMDLWWQRGPINFWSDAGHVLEVRCETGVGGRILEVLDDPAGADLELARITVWEPGVRLAFASSLDDVLTEVRFVPVDTGTHVTVEHSVPVGGRDEGGTAWSRVLPNWFGAWWRVATASARADRHRSTVARRVLRASRCRARWLADVFGFEPAADLPTGTDPLPQNEHGHPWIEFRIGNSVLNVFTLDGERAGDARTHVPWVYVPDLEAHFADAKGSGATIVEELHTYPGSTLYVADDLEGNRWTFLQARRAMR